MDAVLQPAYRYVAGTRTLPASWPLYLIFVGYPLWWALGVGYFIWPVLTLPLLLSLLVRGEIRVPPRFGFWLLFVAWMLLSGVQLHGGLASPAFLWRALVYLSATVLFLYVFNASKERLSDKAVVRVLALFWAEVIVAGFLGVLFPHASFHTPLESLVGASFSSDSLVGATLHPSFAEVMDFLGYPVGRPSLLFPYSNHWGAAAAVLTPLAIALLLQMRRGLPRRGLAILLVLSVVPIVFSLDRGVWLSLCVALAYLLVRLVQAGNPRVLGAAAIGVLATATLVFATPLGGLTSDRFSKESNSTNTRLTVYEATAEGVKESPVFGHGSPVARSQTETSPPAGTQSQLGLVLFSHGVPGLVFFVAWFAAGALYAAPSGVSLRLFVHLAIIIALIDMVFYSLLPTTLHVLMVAVALAWRDRMQPERA